MSILSTELDRYLTIRRSLGSAFGTAERECVEHINTDLFLRWKEAFGLANRQTWVRRLGTVRLFAQWLHCLDPRHEVPPQALIPSRYRRARPDIYSDDEVRRIVETSAKRQFFTDRLCTEMAASPSTIAGFRDTFRLLLRFASDQTGRTPMKLKIEDLDFILVGDFLAHVETQRRNSARSRNARLAAIRSFFRFVAIKDPAYMLHCQRILAMPSKRYVRRMVEFLARAEMDALLAAPDRSTWVGRRDHAILIVALQTGLGVSEIINLRRCDIVTGTGPHIRCEGKGRKQRCTPLRQEIISRDALERLVQRHTLADSTSCALLVWKHVSPHVLRHSTAMEVLHHGDD